MPQTFRSNLDDLIVRFRRIAEDSTQVDVSEALLAGVNAARGQMGHRIFNKGEDAEGVSLGQYVGRKRKLATKKAQKVIEKSAIDLTANRKRYTPYELKRLEAGRQIVYKDLEFEGALRRGIVVIKENDRRVVCAIPSEDLGKIAAGQEQQIGRIRGTGDAAIFFLSEEELQLLIDNTIAVLNQIYDRVFSTQ